jgi:hypothetical protein
VAELAGAIGGTVVEPAVDDDPAADSGADGEADGMPRPPGCAAPPLAEDSAVRVVVEGGRQSEQVGHPLPEWHVHPAQVRGEEDHAGPGIEGAGRAYSDAEQ